MTAEHSPAAFALNAVISVLQWTFMAVTCVVFFFVALVLFVLTLPFDPNGRLLHLFSCFWAALYIYVNPLWHYRIEELRGFPRKGPYVIVANHQSLTDILVLFRTYWPFKWVSKSSVFKVPFLGWNMFLNRYVGLVRGDKKSVGRMVEACRSWLDRGVSVLIFPEGTRSPDGQLLPFKVGAFRIAREARVPVLPIIVDGTADTLPKHGIVLRSVARMRVRMLPPVDVGGYDTDEAAAEAVRGVMARELERMRAGALPG